MSSDFLTRIPLALPPVLLFLVEWYSSTATSRCGCA
jgi:hypothetical protein